MENSVFKQIFTLEETSLRLHVTLLENSIELIILQNENAWKSIILKKNLQDFAGQHKHDNLDDYCVDLLQYIKTPNPEVTFSLHKEEFIIYRLLDKSLKVKFFTCKLEKVNYVEEVEQIMDAFYLEKTQLTDKVNNLLKEKEEINSEKILCESKLKDLVNKRIADEEEQFGRFVLILNEKKRRIQHLTELLEAFKNGRPTVNPTEIQIKKRKSKTDNLQPVRKKETISESESESSNDLQIEDNSATDDSSPEDKPVIEESKPSTSAQTFDFLDDVLETHSLPKRIKRNKPVNDFVVIVEPAKSPPKQSEELQQTKRSKSPQIDLSTQQLLDML